MFNLHAGYTYNNAKFASFMFYRLYIVIVFKRAPNLYLSCSLD